MVNVIKCNIRKLVSTTVDLLQTVFSGVLNLKETETTYIN